MLMLLFQVVVYHPVFLALSKIAHIHASIQQTVVTLDSTCPYLLLAVLENSFKRAQAR